MRLWLNWGSVGGLAGLVALGVGMYQCKRSDDLAHSDFVAALILELEQRDIRGDVELLTGLLRVEEIERRRQILRKELRNSERILADLKREEEAKRRAALAQREQIDEAEQRALGREALRLERMRKAAEAEAARSRMETLQRLGIARPATIVSVQRAQDPSTEESRPVDEESKVADSEAIKQRMELIKRLRVTAPEE